MDHHKAYKTLVATKYKADSQGLTGPVLWMKIRITESIRLSYGGEEGKGVCSHLRTKADVKSFQHTAFWYSSLNSFLINVARLDPNKTPTATTQKCERTREINSQDWHQKKYTGATNFYRHAIPHSLTVNLINYWQYPSRSTTLQFHGVWPKNQSYSGTVFHRKFNERYHFQLCKAWQETDTQLWQWSK